MNEITCPLCKTRILIINDLKEMVKAIDEHVNYHAKEKEQKNLPRKQIQLFKEELEEELTQEVLKEIANNSHRTKKSST